MVFAGIRRKEKGSMVSKCETEEGGNCPAKSPPQTKEGKGEKQRVSFREPPADLQGKKLGKQTGSKIPPTGRSSRGGGGAVNSAGKRRLRGENLAESWSRSTSRGTILTPSAISGGKTRLKICGESDGAAWSSL